jgi:hypothetical protein
MTTRMKWVWWTLTLSSRVMNYFTVNKYLKRWNSGLFWILWLASQMAQWRQSELKIGGWHSAMAWPGPYLPHTPLQNLGVVTPRIDAYEMAYNTLYTNAIIGSRPWLLVWITHAVHSTFLASRWLYAGSQHLPAGSQHQSRRPIDIVRKSFNIWRAVDWTIDRWEDAPVNWVLLVCGLIDLSSIYFWNEMISWD